MFGGLIMDFPLSIQWLQMGLKWYLWTNPINGYKKHKTAGVSFAFRSRAMKWEIMLRHSTCLSWTGCKDLITMIKEPHAWLNFSTELKEIKKNFQDDFKHSRYPRSLEGKMQFQILYLELQNISIKNFVMLVVLFRMVIYTTLNWVIEWTFDIQKRKKNCL